MKPFVDLNSGWVALILNLLMTLPCKVRMLRCVPIHRDHCGAGEARLIPSVLRALPATFFRVRLYYKHFLIIYDFIIVRIIHF